MPVERVGAAAASFCQKAKVVDCVMVALFA